MNLNIRKFPDDLSGRVKACAALRHMSMKDYVIGILEESITREEVMNKCQDKGCSTPDSGHRGD